MDRDDEIFLRLGEVKANTDNILKHIVDLKEADKTHDKRISVLEHERTKIYSIAGVVGLIGTFVGFIADKVWK